MTVERSLMTSAGGVTQYTIANSLRFRSSASAYLSRTPGSAGNRKTWTWSAWVKRGQITGEVVNDLFGCSVRTNIGFYDYASYGQQLVVNLGAGSTNYFINYVNAFRDPSAWYHFVISVDTTQATASNRCKIYVNGIQLTTAGSLGLNYPSQNWDTEVNSVASHTIGIFPDGTSNPFDGYLAEINFIDGQALTPSSFGETNVTTGVWQPKSYTGSYGTNGFKLNFSNGTSTTTLGYDSSGNSNNWTTNNISLTSGATYDWMIDSPTSYAGTSYGVGNYAVFNPLLLWYTQAPAFVVSNGNLSVSESSASTWGSVATTIACPPSGKWYCEITAISVAAAKNSFVGITSTTSVAAVPGLISGSYAYQADGTKWNNSSSSSYGATYASGDVIGVAYDADSATLTFYKNGTSQGTAFTSITAGSYYFVVGDYATTQSSAFDGNFGQRPFAYTPPSGYKSLCTFNLPTQSIVNGASYMAATTYTGTGSSLSVVNTGFQPDLVWIKSRSAATDHALYDVIRGTQARLESNTTDAEVTSDNGLTAFGTSGFTVNTLAQVNTNAATYVGWQWKAGGTAVTNTAGSITSQVSANTTAGFSVVTYTGTGANATVGHGLGVAPSFIIIKSRNTVYDWPVYHVSNGNAGIIWLNQTSAFSAGSAWNSTTPSSSVFSIGANANTNTSATTYVAYCFAAIAGYSAFGSYTGNGSSDGPFVYCGFRPRFVLVKEITSGGTNWLLKDTSRDPYNISSHTLFPNTSGAEDTADSWLDINANGFKIRYGSVLAYNQNGNNYIYAAFAENPLTNALAR